MSWTSVVQTVCALRFFDRITLGRPEILEYIASPQRPFTLPLILSPAEVATLLTTPRTLKHRAILTTFYAAGLRVSELAPLPEAPVSITLKATLHGHEVLVTLRGVDFASVRSQVEDASQWLQAHGGHATQATPQCPTHGAMKPSTKGKGWYCPHTLADGSWCKGK